MADWTKDNVPSGTSQDLFVVAYSANTECVTSNIVATSNVEWLKNISTANGKITIGTVDENTTSAERTGTITVSYASGTKDCSKTIDIIQNGGTQPVVECDCNTLVTPTIKNNIPQTGCDVGFAILSYTSTTDCDNISFAELDNKLSLTTKKMASTGGRFKYDVELNQAVAPNSGTSSIDYTIVMNVNGSACTENVQTIYQAGVGCDCGSLDLYIQYDIPQGGADVGNSLLIFSSDTRCEQTNYRSNTLGLETVISDMSGGGYKYDARLTRAISPNTDPEPRNFEISVYMGETECYTITFEQPGTGCSCRNLTLVESFDIGAEGADAGTTLLTYSSTTNCVDISFSSSTLDLTTNIRNVDGTIYYDAKLNTAVQPVQSNITHDIYMYYDGESCGDEYKVTIEQIGANCTCDSIAASLVYVNGLVPTAGSSEIMILSADTKGCGTIEVLDYEGEQGILAAYDDGKLARVETSGNNVYIYAKANPFPSGTSGWLSVVLNFRPIVGDEPCPDDKIISKRIYQNDGSASCEDFVENYCTEDFATIEKYSASGGSIESNYECFDKVPREELGSPYYKIVPKWTDEQNSKFQWKAVYSSYSSTCRGCISPKKSTLSELCSGLMFSTFVFERYIEYNGEIIQHCEDKTIRVTFKQIGCDFDNIVGVIEGESIIRFNYASGGTKTLPMLFPDCCEYDITFTDYSDASVSGIFSAVQDGENVTITALPNPSTEAVSANCHVTVTGGCGDCYVNHPVRIVGNSPCNCGELIQEYSAETEYNSHYYTIELRNDLQQCVVKTCTITGISYDEPTYNRLEIDSEQSRLTDTSYMLYVSGINVTDKKQYVKFNFVMNNGCNAEIKLFRKKYEPMSCEELKTLFDNDYLSSHTSKSTSTASKSSMTDLLTVQLPKGTMGCFTIDAGSQQAIFASTTSTTTDDQDKTIWKFSGQVDSSVSTGSKFSINITVAFNIGGTYSATISDYTVVD